MGQDDEDAICRNCHEAGGDLIKPCSCSGSLGWVHRDCLNMWRSISPNPHSFTHCDICNQPYYMRRKKLGAGPYVKMILGMIRDITLVLLIVAASIIIPGCVILALESATQFLDAITLYLTSDSQVLNVVSNPIFDVFALGCAFDCFIIGLCAIIYGILRCIGKTCNTCCCIPVGSNANTYYTYNTYKYRNPVPAWWWWYVFLTPPRPVTPCCCCCCYCGGPRHYHYHHHHHSATTCNCSGGDCDCKCSGGGGGGDGDAGKALVIILLIIVLIIICIGFIVGTIFLCLITIRIIRNHLTILQKQKEAQELEVIDLSHGLAKDDPSVVVLSDAGFVNPYTAGAAPVAAGYVPPEGAPMLATGPEPQIMTAGVGPSPDGYTQMPPQFDPAAPVDGPSAPSAW